MTLATDLDLNTEFNYEFNYEAYPTGERYFPLSRKGTKIFEKYGLLHPLCVHRKIKSQQAEL